MLNITKSQRTDRDIIGALLNPRDNREDFVVANGIYSWYPSIAAEIKPAVVGEIGCRWGYSLKGLLEGWNGVERVVGYDLESYEANSIEYLQAHLIPLFPSVDFKFYKCDSQRMTSLGDECFDLFSVDGDHTTKGAYHDMNLVWDHINEGGWMMIDDLTDKPVHAAWDRFTRERGLIGVYVPTLRGLGLVQRVV